jgi:DNA-binding GntR family transcriptional regulator
VASSSQHLTKTEIALQEVRNRLRTGDYEPGRRLSVDELTKELGMSPTPIREALRLLQADHLVTYRPHHGMVVADVSADRVEEISRVRNALEPLATQLAVAAMTPERLEQLEAHHAEFRKKVSRDRRSRADAEWHWTIYDGSGSPFLVSFVHRLWDAFPWRSAHVPNARVDQSVEEHELVMAAIRAGDPEAAAARMLDHLESFRVAFLHALEK